jgi:hypothetical protein
MGHLISGPLPSKRGFDSNTTLLTYSTCSLFPETKEIKPIRILAASVFPAPLSPLIPDECGAKEPT